jgi:hypothetical protein
VVLSRSSVNICGGKQGGNEEEKKGGKKGEKK